MSDTPRTNEVAITIEACGDPIVAADFARILERELIAAVNSVVEVSAQLQGQKEKLKVTQDAADLYGNELLSLSAKHHREIASRDDEIRELRDALEKCVAAMANSYTSEESLVEMNQALTLAREKLCKEVKED